MSRHNAEKGLTDLAVTVADMAVLQNRDHDKIDVTDHLAAAANRRVQELGARHEVIIQNIREIATRLDRALWEVGELRAEVDRLKTRVTSQHVADDGAGGLYQSQTAAAATEHASTPPANPPIARAAIDALTMDDMPDHRRDPGHTGATGARMSTLDTP